MTVIKLPVGATVKWEPCFKIKHSNLETELLTNIDYYQGNYQIMQ